MQFFGLSLKLNPVGIGDIIVVRVLGPWACVHLFRIFFSSSRSCSRTAWALIEFAAGILLIADICLFWPRVGSCEFFGPGQALASFLAQGRLLREAQIETDTRRGLRFLV